MEFHFVKSNFFRVIHADGAWGGATPNGHIQIAFYSQRSAFPQCVREEFDVVDGAAIHRKEAERIGKKGIVREIEVDVVMNLETAKAVHTWLTGHINRLEQDEAKRREILQSMKHDEN